MGALQFVLFVVAIFFFPNSDRAPSTIRNNNEPNTDTLPMLPLLKVPLFTLTLVMLFCGCVSINFVEPNIQLHLIPVTKNLTNLQGIHLTKPDFLLYS